MRRRSFVLASALVSGCALFTDLDGFDDGSPVATDGGGTLGPEGSVGTTDGGALARDDSGREPTPDGSTDEDSGAKPCTLTTTTAALPTLAATNGAEVAWTNVESAKVQDDLVAATLLGTIDDTSRFLVLTGYGFVIPATASIRGVKVTVRARAVGGSSGALRDESVRLVVDGVPVGQSKAGTRWSGTFSTVDYGGPAMLWNAALTPANVSAVTFGVSFQMGYHGPGESTGQVDTIAVTITYCN